MARLYVMRAELADLRGHVAACEAACSVAVRIVTADAAMRAGKLVSVTPRHPPEYPAPSRYAE
jgi:hypothetical protein